MTVFSLLVGIGLIWFACFAYVINGLYRKERLRAAALLDNLPLSLAQTRVQTPRR